MRISTFAGIFVSLLLVNQLAFGAASLFFFKVYNDDFKKSKTTTFMGGDPIYGLINVSAIAVNDNNVTSVEEFADANGGVMIRLYFPDIDKEIAWLMTLASGRVKNNRFLFCVMPEKAEKLDKDYFEVLKVFNQFKGKKFTMNVRAGQKDVTAWWQDDLTIDLTNGMGVYGDWYNQLAPASLKNSSTYYWACESKAQPWVDFRRDEITVKTFTSDSIKFVCNSTPYAGTRVEGYNFIKGGDKYVSFIVKKVDDNSFAIYLPDGSEAWSYYHLSKDLKNEQDINKRCPTASIDKLKEELKPYFEVQSVAYKKQQVEKQKQNKISLTKYAHDFVTKRNDPVLEKKIIQWWNTNNPGFPAMRVFFTSSEYFLVRDEFNQVLRKLVPAVVVYKGTLNSCWFQWNAFGYEHVGGGTFTEELTSWKAGYKEYSNYQFDAAGMTLIAAQNYELDCGGLK